MIIIFLKYNNRYVNISQITNIELVRDSLHKAYEMYEVRITTACGTKLVIHRDTLASSQEYITKLLERVGETSLDVIELTKKEEVVLEMQQVVKKKRTVKKSDK